MKKLLSIALLLTLTLNIAPALAYNVAFNTQTYKYHQLWCRWAKKCTVNCVIMKKEQAVKRGGVPCKVCGG